MDPLRRRIVAEFEKGAGRHDDPAVYGGTPGDPGLIGPDSVSWEINADLASVSQAGLPAIVLEILHPSVVAGVQDLSNYRLHPSVVAGVQDLSNYRRGSVPAGPRHPGLRADHDVRQHRGGDPAHRTRQGRAFLRQGHAPRRRCRIARWTPS